MASAGVERGGVAAVARADFFSWNPAAISPGIPRVLPVVTDDERVTRMYSNRFAGVYLRQHQLASLCRARGWEYRLMSVSFDGYNMPTKKLPHWKMQAELHVDLPPDRDGALHESGLGEQSGFGINLFVETDQVRFRRDQREVAVDEVPALLYSEVMRDVDLFTSVCAIGEDENWRDEGDRGTGVPGEENTVKEISAACHFAPRY